MKVIPEPHPSRFSFALESSLSTDVMDKLWEYISTAKDNPKSYKANLAGNIFSSLELDDTDNWFFDNACVPIITEYKRTMIDGFYSQGIFKNPVSYGMSRFWVNFQKQHEFNPLHGHSGLFSFVIFMKIPYDWREQHELPFVKESNSPVAGNFSFVYVNSLGKIVPMDYKLDSSSEGIMLFFPAEMMHQVHPFYNCEEERITISGNIIYDI